MINMNDDYEIQAQKFLDDTKSKIKISFNNFGKHFIDNKDDIDIYDIKLSRGAYTYKFKFGRSIANSGFKLRYKSGSAIGKEVVYNWMNQANIDAKHDLKAFQKICLSKFGSMGNLEIVSPLTPTAYNILSCITKDNPEEFKDFCDNFGYDTDSIKAHKTYIAVLDEWNNISKIYTEKEIDMLREIQ